MPPVLPQTVFLCSLISPEKSLKSRANPLLFFMHHVEVINGISYI
jgi:hypothetical protein